MQLREAAVTGIQHGEHGNAAGEKNPRMRRSWNSEPAGLDMDGGLQTPGEAPALNSEGMKVPPLPQYLDYPTRSPWDDSTPSVAPPRCWKPTGEQQLGGEEPTPNTFQFGI